MTVRFLISILLLLRYTCLPAQTPISGDSLGKYSYQVMTLKLPSTETHFGTGFFIKKNTGLYFVTARHTFVRCDGLTKREYYTFDQAIVFLNSSGETISLSIDKPKDSCRCFDSKRHPDIVVFEVPNRFAGKVNSVEQFMLPRFKSFLDAEIYGQGFSNDSGMLYVTSPHHVHLNAKTFTFYTLPIDDTTKVADSIQLYVGVTTLKLGPSYKGYSGSPVFLQDSLTKKWRVTGVFVEVVQLQISGEKDIKYMAGCVDSKYIDDIIAARRFGLARTDCQ